MITKKSELFQIRIEPELLKRFKTMSENRGVHSSLLLRHLMLQACEQYEESTRRKVEHAKRLQGGKK